MDIKQVFSLLKNDIGRIEKSFKKYTKSEVTLATQVSDYILSSGGKRVRPALFLLCSKMCGYSGPDTYTIASIIEMLHNASLLHDDVIDDAVKRRGMKAANIKWSNKTSILAGDFLNAMVFKTLVKLGNLDILDLFSKTTLGLINGEIFQLTKEKDMKITEEDYLYIVKNKTAVLMSAAAQSGAILAGRPKEDIKALHKFGIGLGYAFQIIDDALDYSAKESKLGKSLLADLKQGKLTLPLIHVLRKGNKSDHAAVSKIIKTDDLKKEHVKIIQGLLKKCGSIDYVKEVANDYIKNAVKQLKIFPDCQEKEALLTVADYVISRKK